MYFALLNIDNTIGSIAYDLMKLVNQYGLGEFLYSYLAGSVFPGKKEWRSIVNEQISVHSQKEWKYDLVSKGVSRYMKIQPDLQPNIIYSVIRSNKSKKNSLMQLIRLVSTPDRCYLVRCQLCDKPFDDYIEHVLTRCEKLNEHRNNLWDEILNLFGVNVEVELFKLEDETSMSIMLGMTWDGFDPKMRDTFMCTVSKWTKIMCAEINPHQVFINTI